MSVSMALTSDMSLGSDFLATPGAEGKSWSDVPETPVSSRPKRTTRASIPGTKGPPLTLRDQEKHIDNLKKENFSIKLRVHFLEEQLAKLAPDQMEAALKQNISLKIEVQQRGMEMKKLKKLVLELERELDRLQRAGGSRNRERELEEKLEERDRELKELRRRRAGDGVDEEAVQELEVHNSELEEELHNARGLLEENMDEIERLRDIVERRGDESGAEGSGGEGRRERLKRRVEELEIENEELRLRLDEHAEIIAQKEDEKDDLADELNALQLEIEDIQRRREAESFERSESRAQVLEEREEREAVEDQLNALKDRLAAVTIELQQKEDDIELGAREIEDLVAEHQRILEVVDNEWRGEVEEARGQVEELRDVLAERESESKDLRLHISELEANHAKFEAALAHYEEESEQKDAKLESMNHAMEKLSEEIYAMEDENDRLREDAERLRKDEAAERERLEALSAALKLESDRLKRDLERVENELARAWKELDDTVALKDLESDRLKRDLESVENELARARKELDDTTALKDLESNRMKRDLESVENELARARRELDDRDSKGRDRDGALDKLHAENRDLASQLAAQTQARLNISEKLDGVQGTLRTAEGEVTAFKAKVADLEQRLFKDQRSLLAAESQYRDQLTERNTLLLTIYQYLDKILGVDKTPKKSGQAETKPFTNFAVFHDNLITRLKALSQIQLEFDKRCKEVEGRYTEKLNDMRKQLDHRWKQIDKFEASVKAYAETKIIWRRKLAVKEGELEAIKATNAEMAIQLSGIKRPGQTDAMEVRSLTTRAANAERRLNNAQNQLLATEEKVAAMNQRSATADAKWEARVKEYEARLKAAEERVKRERQGSKERVAELENNLKSIQRQFDLAQKRNQQLAEVIETNKVPSSSPGSVTPK